MPQSLNGHVFLNLKKLAQLFAQWTRLPRMQRARLRPNGRLLAPQLKKFDFSSERRRTTHPANWGDDGFDVLADGVVVGRIAASPEGSPWMWTLAFGHHEDRAPTHGY